MKDTERNRESSFASKHRVVQAFQTHGADVELNVVCDEVLKKMGCGEEAYFLMIIRKKDFVYDKIFSQIKRYCEC